MALFLKKSGLQRKLILLVANKVDSLRQYSKTAEFNKLGFGEPIPVSAANGTGTGDLLDIVVKHLKPLKKVSNDTAPVPAQEDITVCILGKPNVGKSSLLNAILGEERVIVSPTPHTTREPQDTVIIYKDTPIRLIDTAGISKKGMQRPRTKKRDSLEKHGIAKSLGILRHAAIAILVLDINEEITHQDAKLVEKIFSRKKSLILVANKWDLVKNKNTKTYNQYIYSRLPFATWAPVHFTSALTGAKVNKLLEHVIIVAEERKKVASQSSLNTLLKRVVRLHKPTKSKKVAKRPRIYALTQTRTSPPEFTLRIGSRDELHYAYIRFIENRIRDKFGFPGTPITMKIQKGRK
jgi:GTP-binding protein